MIPDFVADLQKLIERMRAEKPTREGSLVITKLEEALHWWWDDHRKRNAG